MSFLGEENLKKIELKKAVFVGKATCCICACYWRNSHGNIAACTRTGHMHCFKMSLYMNSTLRNFIIVWHKREFSTQHSCNLLMGNVFSKLGGKNTSPRGCCWVLSRPYNCCGWCYLPHFAYGVKQKFSGIQGVGWDWTLRQCHGWKYCAWGPLSPKSTPKWTELCYSGALWDGVKLVGMWQYSHQPGAVSSASGNYTPAQVWGEERVVFGPLTFITGIGMGLWSPIIPVEHSSTTFPSDRGCRKLGGESMGDETRGGW